MHELQRLLERQVRQLAGGVPVDEREPTSIAPRIPPSGGMSTAPSEDAQCMAAAADRLAGDVLERVSPELVLVDAALAEEARRRLDVPDDAAAARIGRLGIEPRLSVDVAEVEVEGETEVETDASAGDEFLPVPADAFEEEHGDRGIEDLILIPADDLRSVPPRLLMVPSEEPEEIIAARDSDADDVIVVPADGHARPQSTTRSFPSLPSPSSDADEEDATDVVLRLIRDHMEHETPPKRRRRFLGFGS